jgi:hypothetical protein
LSFLVRSIRKGVVVVHLAVGATDSQKKLLKELQKGGPEKQNDSSFRWAVGASREGDLKLQLQVIPLPATEVKAKPLLAAENVAVHVPKSWPIKSLVFDGQACLKGPVPVLFSSAPRRAGREAGSRPGQLQAPPKQSHERVRKLSF